VKKPLDIKPTEGKAEIRTVVIGKCKLNPGVQELLIQPETITGKTLMQLFEVTIKKI